MLSSCWKWQVIKCPGNIHFGLKKWEHNNRRAFRSIIVLMKSTFCSQIKLSNPIGKLAYNYRRLISSHKHYEMSKALNLLFITITCTFFACASGRSVVKQTGEHVLMASNSPDILIGEIASYK